MSEQNNEQVNEGHQDPAEPKKVDEAVQTTPQPVDATPGQPPLVSEQDQDESDSDNS